MSIIALITSSLALILSVYTYLKHDRIIKAQSREINQYQLEKIDIEKVELKKALVEANVMKERGKRTIHIYNKGKCVARNVEVFIPESNHYMVFSNPCPININPQNSISVLLSAISEGCPNKIDISFKWEDDFNKMNEATQTIQLD